MENVHGLLIISFTCLLLLNLSFLLDLVLYYHLLSIARQSYYSARVCKLFYLIGVAICCSLIFLIGLMVSNFLIGGERNEGSSCCLGRLGEKHVLLWISRWEDNEREKKKQREIKTFGASLLRNGGEKAWHQVAHTRLMKSKLFFKNFL